MGFPFRFIIFWLFFLGYRLWVSLSDHFAFCSFVFVVDDVDNVGGTDVDVSVGFDIVRVDAVVCVDTASADAVCATFGIVFVVSGVEAIEIDVNVVANDVSGCVNITDADSVSADGDSVICVDFVISVGFDIINDDADAVGFC